MRHVGPIRRTPSGGPGRQFADPLAGRIGHQHRRHRALRVRGRKTGRLRGVVINVLTVDDLDYLVSPRGTTQWVRNVRAAGEIEMGPRWRSRRFRAIELDDAAKPELLRRYMDKWFWEVKGHIAGLTPDSSDGQLSAAATSIPVFVLADL